LKQRILAALVGLAIVIPLLAFGGPIAVDLVVLLVLLVGLDEFTRMAIPDERKFALGALVATGLPLYGLLVWGQPNHALGFMAFSLVGLFSAAMLKTRDTESGARAAVCLATGLVYIPLLLAFVPWVRRFDHGLAWISLILVVTWAGDTGAYFAGRAFGRTKLFPRVSPNKTWEGAIGGLLLSIVGACVVKALGLPELSWAHAIILGALVDIIAILGDLVESMFKRAFGVKDSGWIMPGHGGILDRVDSLLFTAPATWAYVTVFGLSSAA